MEDYNKPAEQLEQWQQLSELKAQLELKNQQELKNNEALAKANEIVARAKYDSQTIAANRDYYKQLYEQIANSKWWKLTALGRLFGTKLKSAILKLPFPQRFKEGIKLSMQWGIKETVERLIYRKVVHKYIPKTSLPLSLFLTNKIATQQAKTKFTRNIKFSILVPLYNTDETFLREMIDSCINQTYPNWELCLADASDSADDNVGKICCIYATKDKRIVYKKLGENSGISNNTNEAIKMATGDYISLLDHDDILHPSALYENMLAITDYNADFIYTDELTFKSDVHDISLIHLKPDFAIDTLRSNNYICHFTTFSKELLNKAGGFNSDFDGSQDYDIILRLTEKAKSVFHVCNVMYYWRSHAGSVASDIAAKPYCLTAAQNALTAHLKREQIDAEVSIIENVPGFYRTKYKLLATPLISIIIPSKDHSDDLDKCLKSIFKKSTYKNFEIIIVENNSTDKKTLEYYDSLKLYENIQVVKWENEFNYPAINNYGISVAKGEYYLLLNNDVEIISESWLEEMLMFAQRKDVGAVGAKLYYPDDTIQHAGVGLGILTLAGHLFAGFSRYNLGYMGRLAYAQDLSGVTAACMLMKKSVYEEVGGLDPQIKVAFNDVDLCMKIRKAGYLIVFTPFAELYHYESKSRGNDADPESHKRFASEVHLFQKRWKKELRAGDPYLNPNFSYDDGSFSIQLKPYKYVKPKN